MDISPLKMMLEGMMLVVSNERNEGTAIAAGHDADSLAARIRGLRQRAGWTQFELANHARVSPGQVTLVERGITKSLKPEVAEQYAEAFGVSVDYIVHGFDRTAVMAGQPVDARAYFRARGVGDEDLLDYLERTVHMTLAEQERRRTPEQDG